MTNLQFIKNLSATTAATSQSFTDVFTTNYDYYKLIVTGGDFASQDWANFRYLDTSGSELSGNDYRYVSREGLSSEGYYGGTATYGAVIRAHTSDADIGNVALDFSNPMVSSSYTYVRATVVTSQNGTLFKAERTIQYRQDTQVQGLCFYLNSTGANINNLHIKVFGVKE